MSSSSKYGIRILCSLLLAAIITWLIPKNQGSIDLALHDTYFVFSPWELILILYVFFTFIVWVGEPLLKRLFKFLS